MKLNIEFKDFIKSNESGKFLINPYWLEYLLNLYHQGYYGEIWEEIMDTKINNEKTIESIGYTIIGDNLK